MKTQLDAMFEFVTSNLPARLQDTSGFDSWMENIELTVDEKNVGRLAPEDGGGMQKRIAIRRYDGVLAWERWPYRQIDPDVLFALVGAWLGEHADDLRERLNLGSPMPDVEIRDNESAIVAISVPLADELILVPDPDGIIPLRGLRYSLAGAQIRPAETFGIAAQPKREIER